MIDKPIIIGETKRMPIYLIEVRFKAEICEICGEAGETAFATDSSIHLFTFSVHWVQSVDEVYQNLAVYLREKNARFRLLQSVALSIAYKSFKLRREFALITNDRSLAVVSLDEDLPGGGAAALVHFGSLVKRTPWSRENIELCKVGGEYLLIADSYIHVDNNILQYSALNSR